MRTEGVRRLKIYKEPTGNRTRNLAPCGVLPQLLAPSSGHIGVYAKQFTHTHTHTHIYIYIYTHTHTYTQNKPLNLRMK